MKLLRGGTFVTQKDVVSVNRSIFWDSNTAADLFGFEHGTDVYEGICIRMKMLSDAFNCSAAYKSIVEGGGENLTDHQIFHIRQKSLYLHYAYDVALKKLGSVTMKWIGDCCNEAIIKMNEIGMNAKSLPMITLITSLLTC